jgi:hypothetical protein
MAISEKRAINIAISGLIGGNIGMMIEIIFTMGMISTGKTSELGPPFLGQAVGGLAGIVWGTIATMGPNENGHKSD